MRNEDETFCKDRDHQLDESLASIPNYSHPNCGSKKHINMSTSDGIGLYDSLGAQAKEPNYPDKRKIRWETFVGWERSHKLQKWFTKQELSTELTTHTTK